jgi:quinolinate synthase
MLWQPSLPPRYDELTDDELASAITQRKLELGDKLVILGHHYQQDEVIQFADFTGDSFKLAQLAAERVSQTGARYVVFCGVHFMAESADILTSDDVQVILPDLGAGCSMADMADYDDTVDAWEQLRATLDEQGDDGRIIPICYMNSSAAIKAFCGEHGGGVSTSSNCDDVFAWALAGGDAPDPGSPRATSGGIRILFLPDEHLGRNTAASMGFDPVADTTVWDPKATTDLGGNSAKDIERATFILWKGHCSVHSLFRPKHVDEVRAEWPDVTVIVHPECSYEVCEKADMTGSTEGILKVLADAKPGSRWAIGTEVHMVNRICNEAAGRGIDVRILSGCQCMCTTMFRIDTRQLLWVLDNLAEGKVVNQIKVDPAIAQWSQVALGRMLQIVGTNVKVQSS